MGLEILIILLNPLTPITIYYITKKLLNKNATLKQHLTEATQLKAQTENKPIPLKEILQTIKYWTCEYCKTKNPETKQLCQKCNAPQWSQAK